MTQLGVKGQRSDVSEAASTIGNQQLAISDQQSAVIGHQPSVIRQPTLRVALLTGGSDRPYVLGLVQSFTSSGVTFDVIGSDELMLPELLNNRSVNFLNLRGDQSPRATVPQKAARVLRYYWRLGSYAAGARPKIFHILWNNKFEVFDRSLLMFYYKLLGKRVVLTAHNVNIRARDGTDSWLNRFSLRIQYQLSDHIFVHTARMKEELVVAFGVSAAKVSVIPFGINNTTPVTGITRSEAKQKMGVSPEHKTALFFGQIAPYKGLEYLIDAFDNVATKDASYRLIIAGKVKRGHEGYWDGIQRKIAGSNFRNQIIERIEHIPDEDVELYFKAADVLVVPYTNIFQSGLPFLAYSFGLPLIATDVGSLQEDIVEGRTGFVCQPKDSSDLAETIDKYFQSDLFRNLEIRRADITAYANERYSWSKVAAITNAAYLNVLRSH